MNRVPQTLVAIILSLHVAFFLTACKRNEAASPSNPRSEAEAEHPTPAPEALVQFLQNKPTYRLLSQADVRAHPEFAYKAGDANEDTSAAYVKDFLVNEFRSFELVDTNRDGLKDIVAVLIGGEGFNLIVFQATAQGHTQEPIWVLRDEKEPLAGVRVIEANGVLVPLYCLGCSNPVFVWTGEEYERDASGINDVVCLKEGARLYSTANATSKVIHESPTLALAIVVEIGPRATTPATGIAHKKNRWYKVMLDKSKEIQGFVRQDEFDTEPGVCD